MPINFPNSPTNGQTYTDNGITWQYSSTNNSWTMTTFGDPGVSNGTDHDNTLVVLDHNLTTLRNTPVVASGLKYDPAIRTLSVTMTSGQTANVLEFKNNIGTTLSAFNARGILDKAGRIYYGSTAPTVDAADTGQLWCNPSANYVLRVWDGSAWIAVNQASGAVTTDTNQIITATKTFQSDTGNGIELSGTAACIAGSGSNKNLVFKPTTGPGIAVEVLSLSTTAAQFATGIALDFHALGAHAVAVVCTLDTTQVITGLKSFSGNIQMISADNKIFANDSPSGNVGTEDIGLYSSLGTDSRYIKIDGNVKTGGTNGITIRAKNSDGNGKLTVIGDTSLQGNLSIAGSLSATGGVYSQATVYCSVSGGIVSAGNISYPLIANKYTLGPLEIWVSGTNIVVNNTRSSQVRFFYRVEQGSVFGIQLLTIGPSQSATLSLNGNTQPAIPGVSPILVGASSGSINTTTSSTPCVVTITLVN
jgi:hypothetical protein